MKETHQQALLLAQAAVDDCVAIFGEAAETHIDVAVVGSLCAAGYEVKYLGESLSESLPFNAVALLEDGGMVTVDLGEMKVGIVEA